MSLVGRLPEALMRSWVGWLSLAVGPVLSLVVAGCSPPPPAPATPRVVHVFQSKVEIAEALERAAVAYEEDHPGVRLVVETVGGGQDYDAALADRLQNGIPPDLFMTVGEAGFDPWVSVAEDLSDQPWVSDLAPGSAGAVTRDGRLLGNPLAIEGYGLLYNVDLFRRLDIEPPLTLDELERACRRLEAAGVRPFSNGYAEWWVLGNHFFNVLLGSVDDLDAFLGRLTSGEAPGSDARVVEGWMDLLDLTRRYGAPDATVAGHYTASVAAFLAGQAAMIQQGNWIEPDLARAQPGFTVGVLPLPVSHRPDARLPMGVPNFWVVNRSSPVKDDAKRWLEWLRSSPRGQVFLLDELKVIPPYRSLGSRPLGTLSEAFSQAWNQGRTKPWLFPRYQSKTKAVAAVLRAYLEHPTSHETLWANLGRAWSP